MICSVADCSNKKYARSLCEKHYRRLLHNGSTAINRRAPRNVTAKLRHTPELTVWRSMVDRCTNPRSKDFMRYGGRGITVCAEWLASPENFMADMGNRPSRQHSIDRINNDGNYEPSNCRWTTRREQALNRSTKSATGFPGVYRRGKRYISQIMMDKKIKYLGTFTTPEKAHEAYITAGKIRKLHGG